MLTATDGTIYYTVDGTDPRLPGGKLSPAATKFETPIAVNERSKAKARARSGPLESPEWSALAEFY